MHSNRPARLDSYQFTPSHFAAACFLRSERTINEYPRAMRAEMFMSNVSLARIMYGSGDGPRSDYGLNSSESSFPAAPSFASSRSRGSETHDAPTLESLLHKAWQALSAKR
jgi:hypothetical protein